MTTPYTTIANVVRTVADTLSDPNPNRLQAQFRGFAHMWHNDHNAEGRYPKTVLLDVGPDRVTELPADYVDYLVVGREQGGTVRNLCYNPALSIVAVEPFDAPAVLTDEVNEAWPTWCYPGIERAGKPVQGYGYGEYREEFVIDEAERVLRVGSLIEPGTVLVLSYIGSAVDPGKPTVVHPYDVTPLTYFILWQHCLRKKDLAMSREYEKQFRNAQRLSKKHRSKFGYAEIAAVCHDNYTLNVR
ncbi:hypothetical protein [Hymenobacter koreensis]|uniref:Uncharacterized protein n=1 Tax=Hymenobacter koreensis TaxID=1084523 RepID=A0ABP8JK51_9BACT